MLHTPRVAGCAERSSTASMRYMTTLGKNTSVCSLFFTSLCSFLYMKSVLLPALVFLVMAVLMSAVPVNSLSTSAVPVNSLSTSEIGAQYICYQVPLANWAGVVYSDFCYLSQSGGPLVGFNPIIYTAMVINISETTFHYVKTPLGDDSFSVWIALSPCPVSNKSSIGISFLQAGFGFAVMANGEICYQFGVLEFVNGKVTYSWSFPSIPLMNNRYFFLSIFNFGNGTAYVVFSVGNLLIIQYVPWDFSIKQAYTAYYVQEAPAVVFLKGGRLNVFINELPQVSTSPSAFKYSVRFLFDYEADNETFIGPSNSPAPGTLILAGIFKVNESTSNDLNTLNMEIYNGSQNGLFWSYVYQFENNQTGYTTYGL